MRTRALLLILLAACSSSHVTPGSPLPSATDVAIREQTADEQVKQALNRLAFGPRPGDYERVRTMGVDRWIAQQLDPQSIPDTAADNFLAKLPITRMSAAQVAAEFPRPKQVAPKRLANQSSDGQAASADALALGRQDSLARRMAAQQARRVVAELQTAKVGRAVVSERQLQEVMVDFWENHFNVFAGKGPERYLLVEYERNAIRPYAMGMFRDLLGAVAKSPAMLSYLDNWESTVEADRPALGAQRMGGRRQLALRQFAGASADSARRKRAKGLNENYGRELLELHTLGVDGGYTQQDVIAVARAFTGWSVDRPREGGGFVFRPAMHDAGEKIVLGRKLPAGRGLEDGEEVLDILSREPATARFIATKLVRRFVADTAPPALVDRVAETFEQSDGDIRACVRTIVTSPEFFSRSTYKSKIKSPFELVVSALRTVGAGADTTARTAQIIARLGQPLYGHQAPNGYPETGDAWMNTGAIVNRINFGLALAGGRLPGVSLASWERLVHVEGGARADQVDGVVRSVLGGEASPDTRRVLESGINPMLAVAAAADSTSAGADSLMMPGADTLSMMNGESMSGESSVATSSVATSSVATSSVATVSGASGAAARRQRLGRRADPIGPPGELEGLSQMVGLALGAPEFQRR